ncbi:phosphate signaling complex protein PhoU [Fontisphaera persica]|uniref:phosphate signaling complex protein PhoU n=1 Tax=Fontisphaera persica TaxID=2974023 RepID=UPI0024C059EB|nr:phosphate signaling complex protein PhoU [Fontisphaera persica]WCJ59942.1 phosphate signaling complex protein PhoU [Fontisphaera persica]
MSQHFEQEVQHLKQQLLTMASHAENAVRRAVKALLEQNRSLAAQVAQEDDVLDRFEVEIDELAIQALAKAPLASDLRLVTRAMKISHELERIGDAATTIARRAQELPPGLPLEEFVDIPRITQLVLLMLKDALDAFVNHEPDRARAVIPRDKEVDRLNKEAHRNLGEYLQQQPGATAWALHLMAITKSLERIGDHAKNIAEDVVYLYEGRDIRHGGATAPGRPAAGMNDTQAHS